MVKIDINKTKKTIQSQFYSNRDKNIFYLKNKHWFNNSTRRYLSEYMDNNKSFSKDNIDNLTEYYLSLFEKQFYSTNQYIYFDSRIKNNIKNIFVKLIDDLSNKDIKIEDIEVEHRKRICKLIKNSNPLIYKKNPAFQEKVVSFVCEEYSPEFLMDILDIQIIDIEEPILDIGCGKNGNLVSYLSDCGLEVYGIDRESINPKVIEADWIEYDYGENILGLIISNLAFTSHFLHYHLNNDNKVYEYARTYMRILKSLKVRGSFIYAPSIPFFENLLSIDKYVIERKKVYENFYRTKIIKI